MEDVVNGGLVRRVKVRAVVNLLVQRPLHRCLECVMVHPLDKSSGGGASL